MRARDGTFALVAAGALSCLVGGCVLAHHGIDGPVDRDDAAVVDERVAAEDVVRVDVADVPVPTDRGPCPGVDLSADPANCGACGHSCAATGGAAVCNAGVCGVSCVAGEHLCGGHCAADTSALECGAGCVACPAPPRATASCVATVCKFQCDPGFVLSTPTTCDPAPPLGCGNRILDAGEGCDDGNTTGGDGCSATCAMESGTTTEYCSTPPGRPVVIAGPGSYFYTGTTAGALADAPGGAGCQAYGPEVALVVRFTLTAAFSYTVTATPLSAWDLVLRHGPLCPADRCTDGGGASGPESYSSSSGIPFALNIVIDGYISSDSGPFVLRIDVP